MNKKKEENLNEKLFEADQNINNLTYVEDLITKGQIQIMKIKMV